MQVSGVATARAGCAILFIGAGAMHFVVPESYERIVPQALPYGAELVFVSGLAEIAGGVGLLVPRLRRPAGIGLLALLAAVFPANVTMALDAEKLAPGVPEWLLWARLPLQPLLMLLVWYVAIRRPGRETTLSGRALPQ